jgi:hypothetical protein
VFTLKNMPMDTTGDYYAEKATYTHAIEMIPRNIQFPIGVNFETVVVGMPRIFAQMKGLESQCMY